MVRPGSTRSLRIAGRLANGFTLDLVKLGGHRRDVIDALLRAAVLHANLAHIMRDPELQRRFSGLDADVPDEMRRPASVHAIAQSLLIPYETARRRIGGMADLGICLVTDQGVIVRQAATSSPAYRENVLIQYEKLRELYGRLRAAGVMPAPAATAREFDAAAPPVRLVGRYVVEYVLRFTEPINQHIGDPVTGLVMMDMLQANTEHLPDVEAGEEAEASGGLVADERRAPVTALALARRLGVPAETVRRHVKRLEARGLCRKAGGGYIIPAEALMRPVFPQFAGENHANLHRMFEALAGHGVLSVWERQRREEAA